MFRLAVSDDGEGCCAAITIAAAKMQIAASGTATVAFSRISRANFIHRVFFNRGDFLARTDFFKRICPPS
jgi:hypothetical protein